MISVTVSWLSLQVLTDHRRSLSISSVLDKIYHSHDEPTPLDKESITAPRPRRLNPSQPPRSSNLPITPLTELPPAPNCVPECKPTKKRRPSAGVPSLFTQLPWHVTKKVFTNLSQRERGRCMLVCREWYTLIHCPLLWQCIDLREFDLCSGHTDEELGYHIREVDTPSRCSQSCYGRYIGRIDSFISFLIDIKAKIRRLSFAFDLISDNWSATVERLVMFCDLTELDYAFINWRDTPVKPFWLQQGEPRLNDLIYKTRRRLRKFVAFMTLFVKEAPNVTSLILPFEWSAPSISCLTSLRRLTNLTVEKYFVLQRLNQDNLNLLANLTSLKRLVLEIWTQSSGDMFCLASPTLIYLDMSQCRGVFLSAVTLPALEVFITERKPWNGPLAFQQNSQIPCIRVVLEHGAKRLKRFNDVTLGEQGLHCEEVDELLKKVCQCKEHKISLLM